jgi:hypothetical protein
MGKTLYQGRLTLPLTFDKGLWATAEARTFSLFSSGNTLRRMNLQDFWNLDDAELFDSLIPACAFGSGDHYANPWLLGTVRLILAFPFLSESERQLIQDARLTVAELRIMRDQAQQSSGAEERRALLVSLATLESDHAKSMAALEPLFKNGRLTAQQAALLESELGVRLEKGTESPRTHESV